MQPSFLLVPDLEAISTWGTQNSVQFKSKKIQFLPILLEQNLPNYQLLFEVLSLNPMTPITILGVSICSSLSWKLGTKAAAKDASIRNWESCSHSKTIYVLRPSCCSADSYLPLPRVLLSYLLICLIQFRIWQFNLSTLLHLLSLLITLLTIKLLL